MLKDYFEVPNKPAIKSGNILSCDFTDHETFIPQPLDYSRGTIATYVDCNGLIKMSGVSDIELVTNGDFSNGTTGWNSAIYNSELSIDNGQLKITNTSSRARAIQGITTVVGKTYKFQASFRNGDVAAGIRLKLSNTFNLDSAFYNSSLNTTTDFVTTTHYFTATATTTYLGTDAQGSVGTISFLDNVSVREVDVETPRIDYTTEIGKAKELQKPSLLLEPQATNLVTFSNNFNQWSVAGTITRTYNYGISPDGTINSTRVVFSGVNEQIYIDFTSTSGVTGSIYIKGESGKTIKFGLSGAESLLTFKMANGKE